MIAGVEAEHAVRTAVVAWPTADLSELLDLNDAVVCCATVTGGRAAADALVREILGAETTRASGGKPYIAAPGAHELSGARGALNFNISHSGDVLLVALSRCAEVGVDVERVRAVPEWRAIAKRMFDTDTTDLLHAELASGADEHEAFIRCWCRHEAAVKATGEGLFPSHTRDDANDDHSGCAPVRVTDLLDLPLPAGAGRYRGALALLQ